NFDESCNPKSNRSADVCEFMAIELQYEAGDYDQARARIGGKRVGINKGRSDKSIRERIFKPKNTPGRQPKGENAIGCIGTTDRSDGPEEDVSPRGVSAKLKGNPKDACSRDQSQKG